MNSQMPSSVTVRTWIIFLVALLHASTVAASGDRLMFQSKTKDDSTSYISKEGVPFRVDLPGVWLLAANPAYNHVVLRAEAEPRRLVSVFDYSEGLFSSRFYKSGYSEAQAVEEYYKVESENQMRRLPDAKRQVLATDVDGPVQPNLLWALETPKLRVYFLTMSKNKRLISITYQEVSATLGSQEPLLNIFRGMQFPTAEQVDEMLRVETNIKP